MFGLRKLFAGLTMNVAIGVLIHDAIKTIYNRFAAPGWKLD